MVETISLAVTIFWDPNFVFCPRHTLNLAKKLGFKIKSFKIDIVKERMQKIRANIIMVQLDKLFKENLDWWK